MSIYRIDWRPFERRRQRQAADRTRALLGLADLIEEWICDATCDPECDAYRGPNGSACARCEALFIADRLLDAGYQRETDVLREAAPALVDRAAAAARRMAGGDSTSAAIMASIVRGALWQALGCTCMDHSDDGAVYIEDITCPMHGTVAASAPDRVGALPVAAAFELDHCATGLCRGRPVIVMDGDPRCSLCAEVINRRRGALPVAAAVDGQERDEEPS